MFRVSAIVARFSEVQPVDATYTITRRTKRVRHGRPEVSYVVVDEMEYANMKRIIDAAPDEYRNRYMFNDEPLPRRLTYEQKEEQHRSETVKKLRKSKIYLGSTMSEVWEHTNEQTSSRILQRFRDDGDDLSMTLFTGGKYVGMTPADHDAYFVKKARDIDNGIPYFDNQFVSSGKSRLALEFDLKSEKKLDWKQKFRQDSKEVGELATLWFEDQQTDAHVLTRQPYQTKTGIWKYGMHMVFEHIAVDAEEGEKFSETAKDNFPNDNDAYVDGIYVDGVARLRPAFSRKLDRERGAMYGSHFYYYSWSIVGGKTVRYDLDTLAILRKTSLIIE